MNRSVSVPTLIMKVDILRVALEKSDNGQRKPDKCLKLISIQQTLQEVIDATRKHEQATANIPDISEGLAISAKKLEVLLKSLQKKR